MAFETYIADKRAFVFGLDNILYPEKDYLLQVYYLFSEFMEYTEQLNAKEMTSFMQEMYVKQGSNSIFEKTASKFDIPSKYKSNFEMLHENARLPLKLLLYQEILGLLQEITVERKEIYLLAKGNPLMQLNKIRQLEWHGLASYLKVYFSEELEPSLSEKSINFILEQHKLKAEDVLYIGVEVDEMEAARKSAVEFLNVTKLL